MLELARSDADVFVPDGRDEDEALARITHLGICAHADDLEIMAYHGIREGRSGRAPGFGGVVCTDGAGAPRDAAATDAELRRIRRDEQRAAARRGGYAAAIQLGHPSRDLRNGPAAAVTTDLAHVLEAARPEVVYTHSPADRHATHVGTCVAALAAIRRLPRGRRPSRLLGCEVWGSLDWLGEEAIPLELGADDAGWAALMRVFRSQVSARPYDQGALGRSRANAVFREARETGGDERLWLAMDLSPLLRDDTLELAPFVRAHLERFATEVSRRVERASGG